MFANTGPGMKRIARRPVARSSSMTSVPMMSEGIRSGVNWMRLNFRWIACVFATGMLGDQIAAQRAQLREVQRRLDEQRQDDERDRR